MFPIYARCMSTLAVAVPLIAVLPGCLPDETGPAVAEVGTAEQAIATGPALLSHAAMAAVHARSSGLQAARRDDDAGDLFALARGHWVGSCDIYTPGQAEPVQSVEMERITEPTGNPGEYTWTIIYRSPDFDDDVRPYTIHATETPGRYVIDEHNGIELPNYLVDGNVLVSEFQAPTYNIRLFTREVFRGNRYDIEFMTVSMTPELTSVADNGFVIDSFPVATAQRCTLHRRGPRR